MRSFFYYALHSLKNQIRKLFKTWVLVFILVCALAGGLIGFGAARLSELAEETDAESGYTESLEEEESEEEEYFLGFELRENGMAVLELVVGGGVLLVLLFQISMADKSGSAIFLPADVTLLFPSPMAPQSVLLFRLAAQIGAAILASIYLLFQIPSLSRDLGLGLWPALAIAAAWCLTLALGKLLQIFLYIAASTRPRLKAALHWVILAVPALLLLGYLLYWQTSGLDPWPAADAFFNHPLSRFVPLWGWLKGLVMSAAEETLIPHLIYLALLLLSGAALAYVTWHMKADFYEDALAKTEETAALLEQVQREEGRSLVIPGRKKAGEKLRREGKLRGAGASVFFYKTLYTRFRFAHLGFFTKTAEVYMGAAVLASLFCRLVVKTDSLVPVAAVLGVMIFYRSLGSPLREDTETPFFRLTPESAWKKLFFSLMGGTANCFLDVLPGLILAVLILGASPLSALAWLLFLLSMDFYATSVGTFLDLSLPNSIGKLFQQLVQILFLYFGLVPNAALFAVGVILDCLSPAALGAGALNALLGLLFLALTPRLLEPANRTPAHRGDASNIRPAKWAYSQVGGSVILILSSAIVLQVGINFLLQCFLPQALKGELLDWILSVGLLYLMIPLGLFFLRRVPRQPPPQQKMGAARTFRVLLICVFLMYAGNLVSTAILALIHTLSGATTENPLFSLTQGRSMPLRILFTVILAPVVEEYLFRKALIDRLRPYGEKAAMVLSGLMFGLFHGNLSQLFYASALGMLFAFLYLRTGRLRYPIGFHSLINFFGIIVAPSILGQLDPETLEALQNTGESMDPETLAALFSPSLLLLIGYSLLLMGLALAGLILFCLRIRRLNFLPMEREVPPQDRWRTAFLNPGMLLFLLASLALIVSQTILLTS